MTAFSLAPASRASRLLRKPPGVRAKRANSQVDMAGDAEVDEAGQYRRADERAGHRHEHPKATQERQRRAGDGEAEPAHLREMLGRTRFEPATDRRTRDIPEHVTRQAPRPLMQNTPGVLRLEGLVRVRDRREYCLRWVRAGPLIAFASTSLRAEERSLRVASLTHTCPHYPCAVPGWPCTEPAAGGGLWGCGRLARAGMSHRSGHSLLLYDPIAGDSTCLSQRGPLAPCPIPPLAPRFAPTLDPPPPTRLPACTRASVVAASKITATASQLPAAG